MRLIAENVTFTHQGAERPVLEDLVMHLPAGSSTAIVGPSGSGKTTLLSLIGGLLRPQAGELVCVDRHDRRFRPQDVATWVLQTVSLLPDRTLSDNVRMGAYLDGADRSTAERRAASVLARLGLAGRENERARVLSGGEAQRVAIARALASARPVMLADEPTGQLDGVSTDRVLDALLDGVGRTLVLVTHDESAAARCDRVLRLDRGRLHPVGTAT